MHLKVEVNLVNEVCVCVCRRDVMKDSLANQKQTVE
jgi:hypothetical protein